METVGDPLLKADSWATIWQAGGAFGNVFVFYLSLLYNIIPTWAPPPPVVPGDQEHHYHHQQQQQHYHLSSPQFLLRPVAGGDQQQPRCLQQLSHVPVRCLHLLFPNPNPNSKSLHCSSKKRWFDVIPSKNSLFLLINLVFLRFMIIPVIKMIFR